MEKDGAAASCDAKNSYRFPAGGRCRPFDPRNRSRLQRSCRKGAARRVGQGRVVKSFRAGVDIGGTFTDIVLLGDGGERYTKKVSSTVDDYARAIVDGLATLFAELGAE